MRKQKINYYIEKINKSDFFPFIVLALFMIIAHAFINLNYGDDVNFTQVLINNDIFKWTAARYQTWSSRFIIEFILVKVLSYNALIWRAIDVFMIILLSVSISKLFIIDNKKSNNWIIVLFIFMYPLNHMSTAGWGATTINYLWPLSLGMYSLIIIKKIINREYIRWYEYIFSAIAAAYASNMEAMCGVLLGTNILLLIYLIYKEKRYSLYMILQNLICLSNLIFILNCNGNDIRKSKEVARYFPDFNEMSFLKKLEMGFSSSMAKFLFEPNLIFMIFSILILILVFINCTDKFKRFISTLPLIFHIVLGIVCFGISKVSPDKYLIVNSVTKYGIINSENYKSLLSYVPILIIVFIAICILLSIYFCFGKTIVTLLNIYILLIGSASRVIMGFSPTIWASNDRTFLFMYFSIIIVCIVLYSEIVRKNYTKLKQLNNIMFILAALSYIKFIAYIFILEKFKNKETLYMFISNIIKNFK